jgi:hypothetical protein
MKSLISKVKIAVILILIIFGCKWKRGGQEFNVITLSPVKSMVSEFDSIFVYEGELKLKYPKGEVGKNMFYREEIRLIDGNYFVVAEDGKKILKFDSTGKFLRFIGRGGKGPGEFNRILNFSVDAGKNIIVIDLASFKLLIFKYPDYNQYDEIRVGTAVIGAVRNHAGRLVVYSLYTDSLLGEISPDGVVVKSFLSPKDKNLKLFTARTVSGCLWLDGGGNLYFADPISCNIFVYDSSLNLIRRYVPGKGLKEYFGCPPGEFPRNLSPYDVTKEHVKFWQSYSHPRMAGFLNDTLFVVQYYRTTGGSIGFEDEFYFNLVSTSGRVIGAGLRAPHNGVLLFPGDGIVLEAVPGELKGTSLTEARIFRYRLRKK